MTYKEGRIDSKANINRLTGILLAVLCISCFAQNKIAGHVALHGHSHLYRTGYAVTLAWQASTTPSVSYNVYRGTATGGPYTKVGNTASLGYIDKTPAASTFFYVVRAFDGTNESVTSNEVRIP